jgi:tRNA U34 5-methylaminomethyl-2-thiouridine-forming methyltransferase MnmC
MELDAGLVRLMPRHTDTFAEITWEAGDTPLSIQFDDPYFAREDGRAETRHVFISANGLPERWRHHADFTIAELGFGTGLNFFETLAFWQRQWLELGPVLGQQLRYVSFERYPMAPGDIERSLRAWPDLMSLVTRLLEHWPPTQGDAVHTIEFFEAGISATLELHLGDANLALPAWGEAADAWYLDGFSPAKNPELWGDNLMRAVYEHTKPNGTFATYTASGFVRRNLIEAGFDVAKIPGYGRKRESLAGRRPACRTA